VGEQATTNAGILHFAQDDDVKRTTAAANANATADPCGMTNKTTSEATRRGNAAATAAAKATQPQARAAKVDLSLGVFCFVEDHGVEAVADEEA
jgi:hypothetical protein